MLIHAKLSLNLVGFKLKYIHRTDTHSDRWNSTQFKSEHEKIWKDSISIHPAL